MGEMEERGGREEDKVASPAFGRVSGISENTLFANPVNPVPVNSVNPAIRKPSLGAIV